MFLEPLESRRLLSTVYTTLLDDPFVGSRVNGKLWHIPAWDPAGSTYYGRTQIRTSENSPPPKVSHNAVHLALDSHNPTGFSFYGTELISNKYYKVGRGLDLQVTARLNTPVDGGVVGGLFLYYLKPGGAHDEADVELLSNEVASGGRRFQSNIYDNEPLGAGAPWFSRLPNRGRITEYHTYGMRITRSAVTWTVDGTVIRSETTRVPDGPFQIHLNLWAPDTTWAKAYNAAIQPTRDPEQNVRYTMDIDRVLLRSAQPRSIQITSVPSLGGDGYAVGSVSGYSSSVLPSYGVAVFIKVGDGWWTKPTFASPLTDILADGTWSCDIVTGGSDALASEVRAYVLPRDIQTPTAGGDSTLPSSLAAYPFASVAR